MNDQTYLIFSSNHSLYGISTAFVEEIVPLPELTWVPDTPRSIVGAFNLRGNSCLAIDLALNFGDRSLDYQLSDSVIVIAEGQSRAGIIANKVLEVKSLPIAEIPAEIFDTSNLAAESDQQDPFIQLVKATENLLILNNPRSLIQSIERQQLTRMKDLLEAQILNEQRPIDSHLSSNSSQGEKSRFYSNASPSERTIFQQRADELRHSNESQVADDLTSLVIIALSDKLLGIRSEMVQEFVDVRKVAPIPGCPASIVGNMNLRGEILTLIDIRGLLNLSSLRALGDGLAMVVKVENIIAGILIEEVCDAMFLLNPRSVEKASSSGSLIDAEYLQGIAPYGEQMMEILDLPKVFLKSGWISGKTAESRSQI